MLLVDMSPRWILAVYADQGLTAGCSVAGLFSAGRHDRIGCLGFSSEVVSYFPPRHTRAYRAIPRKSPHRCPQKQQPFAISVDGLERLVKRQASSFPV
jgi:hypothetical protein